jgi:DNA-directed RNA polymerase subunit N (RpoN/RPB10)
VACLDCGKEFADDWKSMRIGEPMTRLTAAGQAQPLEFKA